MRTRTIFALSLSTILAGACGGDDSSGDDDTSPDAEETPDAADDVDAPDVTGCYNEADDVGNDGAPEASNRTVSATGNAEICGNIDARVPQDGLIDVDFYTFEVAEATTVRVEVGLTGGAGAGDVSFFVYANPVSDPQADFISFGAMAADHVTFIAPSCFGGAACDSIELPAGTYTLIAQAVGAEPAAAVPYHAVLSAYDHTTSCVTPGTAAFTEARDVAEGAPADDNTQNDVFQLAANFPDTVDALDAPEDSGTALTIEPATEYLAEGVAGVHTAANSYLDVDTYTIVTGATTDTLDIEVSWEGAPANDFDWYLLQEAASPLDPPTLVQSGGSALGPEIQATAVEPNTTYSLVIGSYTGTATDLAYDVTVCGSTAP